jgi:hypothetical protein
MFKINDKITRFRGTIRPRLQAGNIYSFGPDREKFSQSQWSEVVIIAFFKFLFQIWDNVPSEKGD